MRAILSATLVAACLALAACESSVNLDATANVGAQYSSVRVTVKEVWVNESATAAPDDTTWLKFPLSEPETLDLVDLNASALSELASKLQVNTGTYRQIRLFLASRDEALTASAKSAGATFNNEVTFFDAAGVEDTLPLELANAARGIGIEMELVVPAPTDAILAAAASNSGSTAGNTLGVPSTIPITSIPTTSTSSTGSSSSLSSLGSSSSGASRAASPTDSTNATTDSTALTDSTDGTDSADSTTSPSSESTTVTATAHIVFDAARDLTAFRFSDQPGFLLNPTLSAYDLKKVGTIQGQLDLSALTVSTGTGQPDIEVTAEMLNEDSSRRVEVLSVPVSLDGTFVLYPLPLDSSKSSETTFDLVIHGPGVRSIVIRDVPVTKGAPGDGADVALGTVTLTASDSFAANLSTDTTVAPRGVRIGFYQTLPDDDAPYLIEQRAVDPLSGQFATNASLPSASTIVFGTFSSSFSLVADAPQEGASKYSVAALSPLYGEGAFANTLLAPPASATSAASFTVPDVAVPSTAGSGTISATVSSATPGKYDKGALLVTHNGAVVTAASLDAALASSAPSTVVDVSGVPGSSTSGFERGLYYLEAWAWSSSDPVGTFTRQPVSGAVDLRSTLTASATVTVN